VRHRDLLAAITDLEPIQVEGTFERHTSLRWTDLNASPSGGRWGAPHAYEVLYLGRPRDSVVIEAYRHLVDDELDDAQQLAASVLERRVITCTVVAPNILDLRQSQSQEAVGLSKTQLLSDVGDYLTCQAIGAAAHQLGLSGIIAPAASRIGDTLALFPTNLAVKNWPTVTSRDIWHGLPADPRRLRVMEQDAG
jgi:hypothetical protein